MDNINDSSVPLPDTEAELDALYRAITGRQPFRYRADSDPLYRAAADRYIQNGRLAMRDTQGRAAALTGGYGSSYAQAAGQQQYDEYLRQLSAAAPEYYKLAFQQYQAQGQALQDAYGLARQRDADAYARARDAAADERAAAADAYARLQDAYDRLYDLIVNAGYEPTDQELAEAGMTRAQADALLAGRKKKASSARSYGGGSKKKKKSSGSRKSGSDKSGGGTGAGVPGRGGPSQLIH